jgi:hypothetical protein
MEHSLEVSLEELREQIKQAILQQDENLKQQCSGAMALLLGSIIRQQNAPLFGQMIRELGLSVETDEAKWIFKSVRSDLTPGLQAWMDAQIDALLKRTVE